MNKEKAKAILALFRPRTPDRVDPAFHDALDATVGEGAENAELRDWFDRHCDSYGSVKQKFQAIPVPQDLKAKILAGAPPQTRTIPLFHPVVRLAAAAVIVFGLILAVSYWRQNAAQEDFAVFRSRMIRTALQPYAMNLQSESLSAINGFLAAHHAPSNYLVPRGLQSARPIGCTVVQWQGRSVAMVCFKTGRSGAEEGNLWLFVADADAVQGGPTSRESVSAELMNVATTAWSEGGKIYLMGTDGSTEVLQKYL